MNLFKFSMVGMEYGGGVGAEILQVRRKVSTGAVTIAVNLAAPMECTLLRKKKTNFLRFIFRIMTRVTTLITFRHSTFYILYFWNECLVKQSYK